MQIDYNELSNSSVHTIREIARSVGVKSPTMLKKQQLIEQIMKIKNNEIAPQFNKRRVGRPPKSATFKQKYTDYNLSAKSSGTYTLNYQYNHYASGAITEKTKQFSGFLYVDKEYGVIAKDGVTVIVSLSIVNHHKLRTGDYITVLANPEGRTAKLYIAVKLLELQGGEIGAERALFENIKINTEKVFFKNTSTVAGRVRVGGKYFIETTNKHASARELVEGFNSQEQTVFYMNYDGDVQEQALANTTEFKVLFNENEKDKIIKVDLFIECVKRKAEQGKRCVVVFANFWKYMRDLNLYLNKAVTDKVLLDTITKVRNVVALARNLENGGSVTSFIIDCLDMPPAYMEVMKYDVLDNMD